MGVPAVLDFDAQMIVSAKRTFFGAKKQTSRNCGRDLFPLFFRWFLEVCASSSKAARLADFCPHSKRGMLVCSATTAALRGGVSEAQGRGDRTWSAPLLQGYFEAINGRIRRAHGCLFLL